MALWKIVALFLIVGLSGCDRVKEPNTQVEPKKPEAVKQVLNRVSYFVPPPFPQDTSKDASFRFETYDLRKAGNQAVPPTKTDALVCDLWIECNVGLHKNVTTPSQLTVNDVRQAIGKYEAGTWKNVAGYRPWTHWNFIDRLSPAERESLAEEAHSYMIQHGINMGE